MSNPKIVRLTAPLALDAAAAGALPSKFNGAAYTGASVHAGSCVIAVASTTVQCPMPLLNSHDRNDVVGLVQSASKQGGQILVAGNLYSDMAGSSSERIAQLAQRGFPFQMSVGVYDFREEWVPAGNTVKVNGQDFAGPICVLRSGKVRETSVVALGADGDTNAKFFNSAAPAKAAGKTDAEVVAKLRAEVAAANASALVKAAVLRTMERVAAINRLFADLGEPVTGDERAKYQSMPPATWAKFEAKLRTAKASLSTSNVYGRRQALAAGNPSAATEPKPVGLDATSIYAARRGAVLH